VEVNYFVTEVEPARAELLQFLPLSQENFPIRAGHHREDTRQTRLHLRLDTATSV